jgi:multiple sugar transport system permease protein
MGYASALAWLLLIIIGIFTGIAFLTSRYWVYYEDEGR